MARAQPRWPTIKVPPRADSSPARREWRIAVCASCSGWERFYDGAPDRPCPWCDDGTLEQVVVVEAVEGLAERLEKDYPLAEAREFNDWLARRGLTVAEVQATLSASEGMADLPTEGDR